MRRLTVVAMLAWGCGSSAERPPTPSNGEICRSASALDIFDDAGAIDPARYRAAAAAIASTDGVGLRLGAAASAYHAEPQDLPEVYQPPSQEFMHPGQPSSTYQVGGPWQPDPGGFNSTAGQVLFVPDDPAQLGVWGVQFLEVAHNVVAQAPEKPWYYYGDDARDLALRDDALPAALGAPLARPVALARAKTTDQWTQNAVVAFDDGLLITTGTHASGASSTVWTRLPEGLVPTSIALTPNNELALVTVWDPDQIRGGLAVVALAGPEDPGWWGDWNQLYPGLHSYGLFGFIKVLGVVWLPELTAPTAVATSVDVRWPMIGAPQPGSLNLADAGTRARFREGDLQERYARAGFAVVMSRPEQVVAFVDLEPLLTSLAAALFGDDQAFAATRDYGDGPGQWPPTFAEAPASAPTIVATRRFETCPSAVAATVNVFRPENYTGGNPDRFAYVPATYRTDALVGTEDGQVHVFSVGGLRDSRAADPAEIEIVQTLATGRNPTSIFALGLSSFGFEHPVDWGVVSRGDRRVDLFRGDPTSGELSPWKSLEDRALLDPVHAEDLTWFGNHVPLFAIADHGGRQLVNYRYDTITLHFFGGQTFGMGPDGQAEFERGGVYALPGAPIASSATNVP